LILRPGFERPKTGLDSRFIKSPWRNLERGWDSFALSIEIGEKLVNVGWELNFNVRGIERNRRR
jgi:hypothetical protein